MLAHRRHPARSSTSCWFSRRRSSRTKPDPDKRVEFQTLYQELIDDQTRTRRICEDVIDSVRNGRSPLILTERNDHLDRFEQELATRVDHVVVLRAGMEEAAAGGQ